MLILACVGCSKDKELSVGEQQAKDVAEIDNYLEENQIDAQVHESGIRYMVKIKGGGQSPKASDIVKVKYKGYFFSGQTFDANNTGISFRLSQLIDAWKLMIPEMQEGGKITIYAPSRYCYGKTGSGSIPPNSNLIFDIELLAVNP